MDDSFLTWGASTLGELHHWLEGNYPEKYENYLDMLDDGSEEEVSEFLNKRHPKLLKEFKQWYFSEERWGEPETD